MNSTFRLSLRRIVPHLLASATLLGFAPVTKAFVHPGIPFTAEDINQLKANINTAPWSTSYASFAAQSQSSLSYTGSPVAVVSRAPDANLGQFRNDMTAIHNLTWMWLFTNNAAYAQKATDLLDTWAVTNTYFGGDEGCLDLGDYIEKLAPAADILKTMYPGWTAANTTHVNAWFNNVLWPVADVPNPVRGANQGAIQLKIAISLAVFLDDSTKWSQALSVYRNDAAGGLANSLSNGQLGDTGRDDGHWLGQLQALAWSAEVAWKQGVDMFSELDNRLLAASELWAKWSTGQTLPDFIPNGGAYQFNYPGAYANGLVPGIRQAYTYNIIENAYARRLGVAAPETTALHAVTGDDAGTFLFLKTADTSTATQLPAIVRPPSAPATNLTNRDVGDVGLAGSASYDTAAGTWTVTGAGADIPVPPQTAVDAFNYAFQPVNGDAVIVARVTAQGTGRAGIMIRESLAADAKYVGIFLNSGGGTVTTWRGATGWNKTNVSWNNPPAGYQGAAVPPAPWWFKIERLGTRVHVLHSPDGVNWSGLQSAEIAALPSMAYIGLCVTSQNASTLSTATFDHVSITPSGPVGAPALTSATAATATVGTAFSYTATASASPTTYAATGLPAGLGIDAASGVVSGTPTTPGTSLVTLSATNSSGTGTAMLALTVLSDASPAAPTGVTATAVNVYDVNIAWSASANATSYHVQRATSPGGPYTTIVTGVSGTSYLDTTAPSGNVYYVVTALAATLESAPSSEASVALAPKIPAAPTIVNENGQVTLSWPDAPGATGYVIKRAAVSGGPYSTIASNVTSTNYADTGLTNGAYYYYVVSSVSSVESANSPEEFGLPGAKTYTWSPTAASGSWNSAANWVEGAVPTSPAILKFGASTTTTLNNDIASGLEVARFRFESEAPAYTISGNAITLGTEIANDSVNRQTIQVPMTISRIINSRPNAGEIMLGSLATGSVISGSGGFVTRGAHPTSFLGANTFSGGVAAYGNVAAPDVGSPHTLSFSGIGTAAYGPFGTGQVTLASAVLTDTLPYVPSGTSGLRNVLYNDISITTGTNNVITTAGAGALDHYGRLLGGGTVEVAGWNSGWDNYSGSPSFYGDNGGFTGTFLTITHSSFQRLAFNTAASGSALARFAINGNINATHYIAANVSFGELSGAGAIRGNSTLTVGALNTDAIWSGVLSLSLGLTKVGSGTLNMTFVNTYGGPTIVNGGTLRVNMPGSLTSAVTVNGGGTFGGTGSTSSTVAINSGGIFVPGYQGSGAFTASGALTLAAGSTFGLEFGSSTGVGAGATAAQVTLNNATLSMTDVAPGTLPLGTVLTVINNTGNSPVSGTFNGLPEGSDVVVGANTFVITYRGGDGNDIRLHDKRTAALPAAPAGLSATAVSSVQVDLAWNSSPSSDFVSVYTVKRATAAGGPYATVATVNTPHYSDTSTTYNTTYYYAISASNYLGDSPLSDEASATTPPPPRPLAPGNVVVASSNGVITLSWSTAFTAESYSILRATTPGGPYTTIATGVTGTTYSDTTAVNGTSYYYVVTATNVSGISPNSTEVGGAASPGGYSYWPFNEASGSTAVDVWGARNATLFSSNVTRVAGVSGNGLRFDGTSTSYATLPAGLVSALTGDFTISAWVKFDALQNNQRILDFGSSTNNYMFISQNTGSTLRYGIRIGSPGEQGITTGALSLAAGKWVHVAVTMSGTTTTIYINGTLAAAPTTAIVNRPSGVSATANYFGKSQFNDPLLKGTLDDIRIYTRALSAAEIAGMVSSLAPAAPTGLTATGAAGGVAPVSLNWTASPQTTSYSVKRSTVAGGPYTILNSSVSGTAYVDSTATNGAYYYVVTPISGAFEGTPSNESAVLLIPAVVPSSPGPLATAWNNRVDLSWASAAGATSYDVKRATTAGGPYTTLTTVPSTSPLVYSDTTAANGTAYYYVISASNAAGTSGNSTEVTATPVNNPEAEVWTHTDIGGVGISGNVAYNAGTYTVYGSGADIFNQADSFHYLYRSLTGDGAIMARVTAQSTTAETAAVAKAGVMIRESVVGISSRLAEMGHRPDNVSEFIWRTASNVNAAASTSTAIALPRWLKVVRSGNTFTAFHSANGVTWTQQGAAQTLAMASNTYVGLVFCAAANAKRGQATFDHVSIASALPVITSATTASATVGAPFNYTIVATNSPSLFTAVGLPDGLTLNDATGVISGAPTKVGSAAYTVTLTATNAIGTSSVSTLTVSVAKGSATVALGALTPTYDGSPKAAAVTTTPAGLVFDLTYNGGATPPVNAGSYAVAATINDANYTGAASATLTIAKATPVVTVTPYSVSYDGAAHTSAGTATGVLGESLSPLNLSGTTHTNAGNYADVWTFTDTTGNYANASGPVTDVIAKANAAVTVTPYNVIYDGAAHTATGTATGVGGEPLAGLDLSATTHTTAGSYPDAWTFADVTGNYANISGSTTNTISKATATLSLAPLTQAYDGTPRVVTATTDPSGLTVKINYDNGSPTAPIYPGAHLVTATIDDANYEAALSQTMDVTITALVRHASTFNGIVDGSVQMLLPESVTLNSGASLSGDLLVPGTPGVLLNGSPTFAATKDGPGLATPTNYAVTLNSGAVLRYLVRHVNAIALPIVAAPPAPTGTRDVTINSAGQSPGNFATLRNLTLNSNAGTVAIPPGTYGTFTANGSSFVLGVAGATEPAIYNLQSLTLNSASSLQVIGPVILTLANGVTINGTVGNSVHPEWLTLNVSTGGVTLNSSATLRGVVNAPAGTVILNGATLVGRVSADRLTLNSNALLDEKP